MSESSTSPEKVIDLAAHRDYKKVSDALAIIVDDLNACLSSGDFSDVPSVFVEECFQEVQRMLGVVVCFLKVHQSLTPEVKDEIRQGLNKHLEQTFDLIEKIKAVDLHTES